MCPDEKLKYNKFISILMKYQDAKIIKPENVKYNPPCGWQHLFFKLNSWLHGNGFAYTINALLNESFNEAYSEEKNMLCAMNNQEYCLGFNNIWEFCQFIKYAEKTQFFFNDINNSLYVDSDIYDCNHRGFSINNKNYKLTFKLERVKDPENSDNIFKTINIEIERNYGRKMKNTFIVVNRSVKYNDDADKYLIQTVNQILQETMINTFTDIMDNIRNNIMHDSSYLNYIYIEPKNSKSLFIDETELINI